MKEQQQNWRKGLSGKDYRRFLATFKTQSCPILDFHYIQHCQYFHPQIQQQSPNCSEVQKNNKYYLALRDRRRNPYGRLNQFLYCENICPQIEQCLDQECEYCHNAWEYNYHPLNFKTINCQNLYDCMYGHCYKIHYKQYTLNQKTQSYILNFNQFFRFDLNTFKTKPCQKQYPHDKSFCFFYHSTMDYRRPNFEIYQHTECPYLNKEGCSDANCSYSHNKIEQLYHPRRYKSKFCQNHYNSRRNAANPDDETSFKSMCPFGKLCSFAHNDEQITIDLIDKFPRNLEFYLYMYKTVWCPITTDHNRSQCVYAHNIQDFRRSPKEKYYQPIQCPFWKKNENIKCIEEAGCPAGMDCNKCHGWKQKQYHPVIYSKVKVTQTQKSVKLKDSKKQKSQSYFSSQVKSKTDSSQAKQSTNQKQLRNQVVSKKLGTGVKNNTKIQAIVEQHLKKGKNYQQKQNIYSPGTPFFKNNQATAKKKTKSQHGETKKQQIDDKMSQMEERGSLNTTKSIQLKSGVPYLNFASEQPGDVQIFKAFQSCNQNTCDEQISSHNVLKNQSQASSQGNQQKISHKNTRVVSKSVECKRQKSGSFYSKDTIQLLNPTIVNILKQNNISQIKLINMNQADIRKITELSNSQKSLIIKKVIMTRDVAKKTPTYEDYLIKFFMKHKREQTLNKLRNKKVKQERLFLMNSQIKQFSFLTQSEKNDLPKLLKQLNNNRDFQSLNDDIFKTIKDNSQDDQQVE